MTPDFRSMPSTYTDGGEMQARELVAWAEAYAESHVDTFGGAWFDYVDDRPISFASFTGDLEIHRRALDPRIEVVPASDTLATAKVAVEAVRGFVESHAGARLLSFEWVRGLSVLVEVEADDEDAFEDDVRSRFGATVAGVPVDVFFVRHGRVPEAIDEWTVDPTGRRITVSWIGGGYQSDWEVDVEETDDEVRLTLSNMQVVQHRGADSNVGEEIAFGNTLEGYEREVTVELARPVGARRIVDTERDPILDRPPVKRSWRQRRQDSDVRILDAMAFVERLAPEASPSGTEYENGWVVIDADVDDPEPLRASLVQRFGEGYEVRGRRDT